MGRGKNEGATGTITRRGAQGVSDLEVAAAVMGLELLGFSGDSDLSDKVERKANQVFSDLCQESLTADVRRPMKDKLYYVGLSDNHGGPIDPEFEVAFLDLAASRLPQALKTESPMKSDYPDEVDTRKVRAIATRVVVDSASSLLPSALHQHGAEAIRRHAESEYDSSVKDLLEERNLSAEEAASYLTENSWAEMLRFWDTDRFRTTDSASSVFRRQLVGYLMRATPRPSSVV